MINYNNVIKKMDYILLQILICEESNTAYNSISTPDLITLTQWSHVKVGQVVRNFAMFNFVAEGHKDGLRKTYYITQSGLDHFKEVMDVSETDIDDMIEKYAKKKIEMGGVIKNVSK